MSRLERQAAHVDVVRRVESGHVLVLESFDLEELVGEMAEARQEGWEVAGFSGSTRTVPFRSGVDLGVRMWYSVLHVRGVPGSPLGMDMQGGE